MLLGFEPTLHFSPGNSTGPNYLVLAESALMPGADLVPGLNPTKRNFKIGS